VSALVTLPLVVAVIFVELAVGGAFLIWLFDRSGQAPAGFLRLSAAVNLACAGIAAFIPRITPRDATLAGLDPEPLAAFGIGLVAVALLMAAHFVTTLLPSRDLRTLVGIAALLAGVGTLGAAAVARPAPSGTAYDVFALLALPVAALALGGSSAAMLLGHWYLVTPKLPTGPLQRAALVVAGAVVVQIGLAAVAFTRGDLQAQLQGALVVAAGLRLGVGLLMTLGVALAAWWTAKTNTQSATGLLYVGLGTVLAGEISARVIFFLQGVAI